MGLDCTFVDVLGGIVLRQEQAGTVAFFNQMGPTIAKVKVAALHWLGKQKPGSSIISHPYCLQSPLLRVCWPFLLGPSASKYFCAALLLVLGSIMMNSTQ